MKKMMMLLVMLTVVVVANAQRIASQDYIDGTAYIFLEDGRRIAARDLPSANYRSGYTIEQCIAERQYERQAAEARRYRVDPSYDVYGMYGGVYGGYIPYYGAEGSSFSIGNSHWGVSTSSSNYGGYKRSSTGINIGGFHIGTSSAKYEQPTYRGTSTSSASYQAQKKADAKKATARYSQMRANGVVNGSTKTNTSSNTTTAPTGMWNY
jgi:hypothetical protein